MTIASLADVMNGLQPSFQFTKLNSQAPNGVYASGWGLTTGFPPVGALNATLTGVTLSAPQTGQLPFNNPPAGQNAYVARLAGFAAPNNAGGISTGGAIMLCDRLWHNGGIDQTGAAGTQVVNSPAWPARDLNQSSNGEGVYLAIENNAVMAGAGTPVSTTFTVSYTNSAGVAGRTANLIQPPSTAGFQAASFFLFSLQPGDLGVQSVQNITITPSIFTTGTLNLVAFRPICMLDTIAIRVAAMDAVTGALPQVFNNSVPFIVAHGSYVGSGWQVGGELQFTWG